MPLLVTLEKFIARVEHNKHVEAIDEFYTDNASMQENNEPPRVGKAVLMAHEAAALGRVASVESTCVRPVFQHDDHVVIRWIFKFTGNDGSVRCIEELAYQRWEGEHIVQEQFFYDPKQFVAKTN
jgi:SnoaL-like domain